MFREGIELDIDGGGMVFRSIVCKELSDKNWIKERK